MTLRGRQAAGSLVVPVDLAAFRDLVPFDPYVNPPWWGCAALDLDEVRTCQAPNPGRRDWGGGDEPRSVHTARVAWLVRNWANDGTDPVEVEVCGGVRVFDGWHRISAAIARGEQILYVELSGFLDEALAYGFPISKELAA
jgi:hypothetical protein